VLRQQVREQLTFGELLKVAAQSAVKERRTSPRQPELLPVGQDIERSLR
jgi:hypothetical protein